MKKNRVSKYVLTQDDIENIRRNPPKVLSVPEGAFYLGIGKRTLWDLISRGAVKRRKIGGRTVLLLKDIDAFMEGGQS